MGFQLSVVRSFMVLKASQDKTFRLNMISVIGIAKKGKNLIPLNVHIVDPKEIVKEGDFWKNVDNGKRTTCVKLDGDDLAYCWKKLKSEYEPPYESMVWIWP